MVEILFCPYALCCLCVFHLALKHGDPAKCRNHLLGRCGFSDHQGRNEGEKRAQRPGRRISGGALKSPDNVASTFFNTVHLLPKDLRFEHRAPNLFLSRAPPNLGTPMMTMYSKECDYRTSSFLQTPAMHCAKVWNQVFCSVILVQTIGNRDSTWSACMLFLKKV